MALRLILAHGSVRFRAVLYRILSHKLGALLNNCQIRAVPCHVIHSLFQTVPCHSMSYFHLLSPCHAVPHLCIGSISCRAIYIYIYNLYPVRFFKSLGSALSAAPVGLAHCLRPRSFGKSIFYEACTLP